MKIIKFIKRLLQCIIIDAALGSLTVATLMSSMNGVSSAVLLWLGIFVIVCVTIGWTAMWHKAGGGQVWIIPFSQMLLCAAICLFLYARDLLGFRHSSGWLDFGVGFDIIITILISAFWIVPSVIIAAIYTIAIKIRSRKHKEQKGEQRMNTLFSDYIMRGKTIKNRIVVPPMVCFFNDVTGGFVTERNIAHYEALAKGGSGLIIVEAACVSEQGRLHPCQLGLWDDKFIDGMRELARVIHESGAVALVQLHHAGLKTSAAFSDKPFAPSDYIHKGVLAGHEMSLEDIELTTEQFVAAALRAQKAGFDGVEIHGCHAYLISQFLSPDVNVRADGYGQDKAKFAVDIIEKIVAAVGEDFIVGIRTSGNDPDMRTSVAYAQAFERAGADYLHVSTGFSSKRPPDMVFEQGSPYNWIAHMGMEIKKHVSVPVIVVNGIKTPEQAKGLVERAHADFVAVGKGQLVDENWANKARDNKAVDVCLGCARCKCFVSLDACVKKSRGEDCPS